ncbi:hypothetical protein GCM10010151_24200 [Actinoallomurus spadix]|uniref:Uncharacterized protein n=1 Tax=Actinoallomurus spadix TaxID=79912 RepID=A0ABN0WDE5_9ACTN
MAAAIRFGVQNASVAGSDTPYGSPAWTLTEVLCRWVDRAAAGPASVTSAAGIRTNGIIFVARTSHPVHDNH